MLVSFNGLKIIFVSLVISFIFGQIPYNYVQIKGEEKGEFPTLRVK